MIFRFVGAESHVAGAVWELPGQIPVQEHLSTIHKTCFSAWNRSRMSHGVRNTGDIGLITPPLKRGVISFLNKSGGINEKWELEVELAFHEGELTFDEKI